MASDRTLVTIMARVGTTRHLRRNMPKVAKNDPASTNSRSPATPCTPMVVTASPPITTSPATMTSAPVMRFGWQAFVQDHGRQHEAQHGRG